MEELNQKSVYQLDGSLEKQFASLRERHTRWEDKRINLLTFSINLFFTIAIAAIGLIINNYESSIFKGELAFQYPLPKVILYLLATSTSIGIAALWSRLYDFRLTAKIVNKRKMFFKEKNKIKYDGKKQLNQSEFKTEIGCLRCLTHKLGKITWWLFLIQSSLVLLVMLILLIKL